MIPLREGRTGGEEPPPVAPSRSGTELSAKIGISLGITYSTNNLIDSLSQISYLLRGFRGEQMAKASGKSNRKGITLLQAVKKFEDEEKSHRWFEEQLWPDGPFCPHCGSFNVQSGIKHPNMTHRCRDCSNRPMFSVRLGTILENTRLPYRTWALGIYLFTTNLKGISSMKLHRELGITQKTAWFMLHRLRTAMAASKGIYIPKCIRI